MRPYMVINTHMGLFRIKPFAYKVQVTLAIFQRHMESLLAGKWWSNCVPGQHSCHGQGRKGAFVNTWEGPVCMQQAGLWLKQSKCFFMASSVVYISGHRVNHLEDAGVLRCASVFWSRFEATARLLMHLSMDLVLSCHTRCRVAKNGPSFLLCSHTSWETICSDWMGRACICVWSKEILFIPTHTPDTTHLCLCYSVNKSRCLPKCPDESLDLAMFEYQNTQPQLTAVQMTWTGYHCQFKQRMLHSLKRLFSPLRVIAYHSQSSPDTEVDKERSIVTKFQFAKKGWANVQ